MSVQSILSDGVLAVRLCEEKFRNALDLATVASLRSELATARGNDAVRMVRLESGVDRVFCLGMNLEKLEQKHGAGAWDVHAAVSGFAELLIELASMPVPTLAVVDGIAAGGGVELACICDSVIATSNASFSVAQLRKGIFPFLTSAVLIPKIGQSVFLHWALSGQSFPAKRLFELGLVQQLCANEDRDRTVSVFCERVCSFDSQTLRAGMSGLRNEGASEVAARIRRALPLFALNCLARRQAVSP